MAPPTAAPAPQRSGYEIHLDLGSIQGESESSLHTDEIEILSFSWGATNSAVRSAAGSPKGGKPTVSEITITKEVDKASAQLFSACVNSTLIKTATISWSKSTGGGKPEDYMVYTLTNVYVTSVQSSSSKDQGPQLGTESVTLNFQKISIDYKVQMGSGLLVSGSSAAYDLGAGK